MIEDADSIARIREPIRIASWFTERGWIGRLRVQTTMSKQVASLSVLLSLNIHRFGTNNLWGYPLVEAEKPFEGDSGEATIL